MTLRKRHLLALLAAGVVVALLPTPAAAAPTVTVVTSGLDSPRGVAFFDGKLVVGEAGHGGSSCFDIGAPFQACIGNSSQISWVNRSNGTHTPLVSGLFSVSLGPEGTLGVSGLSTSEGRLLAQLGATPREAPPTIAIAQQQAGRLLSVRPNGTWTSVAPVGTVDFDYTTQFPQPTPGVFSPNTQEHDSNPYGVLATDSGVYVADAGANTLDRVSENGKIRILIHDLWRDPNPNNFPSDSVPTCVVQGDEGLLVGELSGRLLKVHGTSFTPVVVRDSAGQSLLTHVTGCTSDGRGNLYFVNMFGPGIPFTDPSFFVGNVVQYNPETGKASVLVSGLQFPNMDTIGPDGNLYVSAGSICASEPVAGPPCFGATGRVLKITLPHDENDNQDQNG